MHSASALQSLCSMIAASSFGRAVGIVVYDYIVVEVGLGVLLTRADEPRFDGALGVRASADKTAVKLREGGRDDEYLHGIRLLLVYLARALTSMSSKDVKPGIQLVLNELSVFRRNLQHRSHAPEARHFLPSP